MAPKTELAVHIKQGPSPQNIFHKVVTVHEV